MNFVIYISEFETQILKFIFFDVVYASNSPIIPSGQKWSPDLDAASEKAWFQAFSPSVRLLSLVHVSWKPSTDLLSLLFSHIGGKYFPGRRLPLLERRRNLVQNWFRWYPPFEIYFEALVSPVGMWGCEYESFATHESFVSHSRSWRA